MTSSDKNCKSAAPVPRLVLVDFSEVKDAIDQNFALIDVDRDELVHQIFSHYLVNNHLDCAGSFKPNLEMMHLEAYLVSGTPIAPEMLTSTAHAVHHAVRRQFDKLGMRDVVTAQGGFYYALDHFRPCGQKAVLRNLDHPESTHNRLPENP